MPAKQVRAYVGLGANVGDSPRTLAAAVRALAALPGVGLRGVSRLYATRPVGGVEQADFHNAAVALDVPSGPDPETGALALLIALKQLERAFGRRERERWGPRELDLDLLVFGPHRVHVEPRDRAVAPDDPGEAGASHSLDVPHASAAERLFVIAPLSDLAPRLVPPGWERNVTTARRERQAIEGSDAVRPVGTWNGTGWST
jgi:2-amino-4-hydroxy-6-hydroxymethyldihydropteridine diphosphokinase